MAGPKVLIKYFKIGQWRHKNYLLTTQAGKLFSHLTAGRRSTSKTASEERNMTTAPNLGVFCKFGAVTHAQVSALS